jgi:hypothetical protein
MTGVEAVSNAVPIFRPPTVPRALRTLTIIVLVLMFLLAGVAFLCRAYDIGATPPGQPGYQSVLSQMVEAVAGRGVFYQITMAAILAVLALSANTSFADFPRVCRLLALDEFLPAGFAHRGRRLVYTEGIVVLALLAGALLIAFGGITDRLIPLFAVGAFLAFTLSQLGMVAHWRRVRGPRARRSIVLNGAGAAATASTLVVISIAKLTEGAWITIVIIPALVFLFLRSRRHDERVESETAESGPIDLTRLAQPIVVVPMRRLDRVARKALRLAVTLSREVRAVQVLAEELKTEDLSAAWPEMVERPARESGLCPPKLEVVPSPYRDRFGPLIVYVQKLAAEHPGRHIAVLIPELVQRRWYHLLLRQEATLLKSLLLLHGGPWTVVISTPWYLRDSSN